MRATKILGSVIDAFAGALAAADVNAIVSTARRLRTAVPGALGDASCQELRRRRGARAASEPSAARSEPREKANGAVFGVLGPRGHQACEKGLILHQWPRRRRCVRSRISPHPHRYTHMRTTFVDSFSTYQTITRISRDEARGHDARGLGLAVKALRFSLLAVRASSSSVMSSSTSSRDSSRRRRAGMTSAWAFSMASVASIQVSTEMKCLLLVF